jgi:hypothetical protein
LNYQELTLLEDDLWEAAGQLRATTRCYLMLKRQFLPARLAY